MHTTSVVERRDGGIDTPALLLGTYQHRIDAKGRVAVPSSFRRELPPGSVVAPGPERRLVIWPPDPWKEEVQRFRRTSETSAQERRFMRLLFGNSARFEMDAQGRMLLTPAQRRWASIEDIAVFTGLSRAVEITGESVWLEQQGDLESDAFNQLTELVSQRSSGHAGPA